MRKKIAIIIFMIALAAVFIIYKPIEKYTESTANEHATDQFHKIWPNINLLTDVTATNFFAQQWQDNRANPHAKPIAKAEKQRVTQILIQELAKYPRKVLAENLQAIALCSTLSVFGVEYGATTADNRIYLTSLGQQQGYTDTYIRKTLHHEFSSILMRNNNFPMQDWLSTVPDGFSYAQNIQQEINAINRGWKQEKSKPDMLEKGFLSRYGMSTEENDINTYAGMLFTDPNRLKQLAQKYDRIKTKYNILVTFYHGLDKNHKWYFDN